MRSMKNMIPSSAHDQEVPYVRNRENPFFNGLLRGDDDQLVPKKEVIVDTPHEDFLSDNNNNLEPYERSSSGKLLKNIPKIASFEFLPTRSDIEFDLGGDPDHDFLNIEFTTEAETCKEDLVRPSFEKSYSVIDTRTTARLTVSLPQSAASFYNGSSPQFEVVESCESIERLNTYLKTGKDEVNAGVPGKYLLAVMANDASDIGSMASTIMYAFYLNETRKDEETYIVPVVNMKRTELKYHDEIKWLLGSCRIDQSSLIFIDEIDLPYYQLFGSLKLVLVNTDKLPTKQEAINKAVVETFSCKNGDECCSCCTLIAEMFAFTSPEILTGQGLSRLLLAGILFDTRNLSNPDCTLKDKYITTLLINGAGRFGCNGLHQILRHKMNDGSNPDVIDNLWKDYKRWKRVGNPTTSNVGMSCVGISAKKLLAGENNSIQEIKHFQQMEKLQLLVIVSGYYDVEKNFKREILAVTESREDMISLLSFFDSNASRMPLSVLHQTGVRDDLVRAFESSKVISRRTIEGLLEEFCGAY